jgi:hypothetical protein
MTSLICSLTCTVASADVHGRPPQSLVIVTQLVTLVPQATRVLYSIKPQRDPVIGIFWAYAARLKGVMLA